MKQSRDRQKEILDEKQPNKDLGLQKVQNKIIKYINNKSLSIPNSSNHVCVVCVCEGGEQKKRKVVSLADLAAASLPAKFPETVFVPPPSLAEIGPASQPSAPPPLNLICMACNIGEGEGVGGKEEAMLVCGADFCHQALHPSCGEIGRVTRRAWLCPDCALDVGGRKKGEKRGKMPGKMLGGENMGGKEGGDVGGERGEKVGEMVGEMFGGKSDGQSQIQNATMSVGTKGQKEDVAKEAKGKSHKRQGVPLVKREGIRKSRRGSDGKVKDNDNEMEAVDDGNGEKEVDIERK